VPHETEIRVRFNELDPYGHVNHAVYVSWFEEARIRAMADVGIDLHAFTEAGVLFVITGITVDYLAPAVAGDVVTVTSELVELGRVRGRWHQEVRRGDTLLVRAEIRTAVCGPDGRPTRPDPEVMASLHALRPSPAPAPSPVL
jgi:acyl-CoA thioester hydrolase